MGCSPFPNGVGNERFNAEAAAWDSNPFVHEASAEALKALQNLRLLPADKADPMSQDHGLDVLEIGCGTGLLTLLVAPYARQIVAVDAARGMIDALSAKLARPQAPSNV